LSLPFWVLANVVALAFRFDPYPFILLNLLFSTQAAYAAPIIMMAQNRAAGKDRLLAAHEAKTVDGMAGLVTAVDEQTRETHRLTLEIAAVLANQDAVLALPYKHIGDESR